MRPAPRALGTAAWLLCVVATALPSWVLIGLAGGRVGTTAGALLVLAAAALLVVGGVGARTATVARPAGPRAARRSLAWGRARPR